MHKVCVCVYVCVYVYDGVGVGVGDAVCLARRGARIVGGDKTSTPLPPPAAADNMSMSDRLRKMHKHAVAQRQSLSLSTQSLNLLATGCNTVCLAPFQKSCIQAASITSRNSVTTSRTENTAPSAEPVGYHVLRRADPTPPSRPPPA